MKFKSSLFLFVLLSLLLMSNVGCEKISLDDKLHDPIVEKKINDMPRGYQDADFEITIFDASRVSFGTTIFADLHDSSKPRIIEINLLGEIVWEYYIPKDLIDYINPGLDVEVLANNNVLYVLPHKGVYEINRDGKLIWSHLDTKISHDADRLVNGNTIYTWAKDEFNDYQVKEVDKNGNIVWQWRAKEKYFEKYRRVYNEGWTYTNAVTRLDNGSTVLSLRNFNLTIEINTDNEVVLAYEWRKYGNNVRPYDPEVSENTLLIALQNEAIYPIVEIERENGEALWSFSYPGLRSVVDADQLDNGNILVVGVLHNQDASVILEITREKKIVWQLKLLNNPVNGRESWFYKAQRLPQL